MTTFIDRDDAQAIKDDLHEKLQGMCDTDPVAECWTYRGTIQESGIGVLSVRGRQFSAHRVSAWVYLADGKDAFDLDDNEVRVDRTCDNQRCINYEHLAIKRLNRKPKEGTMKLVLPRKTLLSACNLAAAAVSSRDLKPVLRNVKFIAGDEGCALHATDLEIGICATLPPSVQVEAQGESLWPHARLTKIVSESLDEQLCLTSDSEICGVKGTRSEFELPAEDAANFPDVQTKNEPHHQVKVEDMRLAIKRTLFAAASAEHSRFGATTGIKFDFTGSSMTLVATDGRRLARVTVPAVQIVDKEMGQQMTCIVPKRAMAMLDRALADGADDENATVQIGFGANDVCFKLASCSIYSRLVEGRFPNWRQVVPKAFKSTAGIKAGPLLHAARQAAIMTDLESVRVNFHFDDGRVSLKSASSPGRCRIEAECEYTAKALDIAFDPAYLIDMLKTLDDGADVAIKLTDGQTPAVFEVGGDYQYVVVPLVAVSQEAGKK